MLLPHAATLAEARACLAALADQADQARSFDASVEYERVLLRLDALHGEPIPGISPAPTCSRDVLFDGAYHATEALTSHGVDLLAVELLLDMLQTARSQDPT